MLDGHPRFLRRMLVADQNKPTAPRCDFLHVRHRLFEHRVVRGKNDHGHRFVDERDRPMLEFTSCVAFGVDVAQLLEL